jgi:hypothetical protein
MDLGYRIRIIFAAAIALAAGGSIALAESAVAGNQLLPDLKTLKPFDSDPLRLAHNSSGKVTLRISNRIGNQGTGPLELYPEPATETGPDCTPGEYPDDNDLDAHQRIFGDTNPVNGLWDETDDVVGMPKVGCFEFHPAHGHWHFQDFSVYSLTDPDDDEIVAGPSRKIGFCILDGDQFDNVPDYPKAYPGGDTGCGQSPPDDVVPPGTMGLSIGWADTYTSSLPGQRLDVAGVPKGTYCLISTANPEHDGEDPSQIIESNPDNNSRRRLIKLNPLKKTVALTGERCPAP